MISSAKLNAHNRPPDAATPPGGTPSPGTASPTCRRAIGLALAVMLPVVLAACGGRPIPFPTPDRDLGGRPGLLTGKTGGWDILSPSGKP